MSMHLRYIFADIYMRAEKGAAISTALPGIVAYPKVRGYYENKKTVQKLKGRR